MNTSEKNLGVNASLDDIRSELFEGDNIVLEKSNHVHPESTGILEQLKGKLV